MKRALVELLRCFAARTARERGVRDPRAQEQLAIINGAAKSILVAEKARS